MKSFLGWAVDSIDMYISLLDRKPRCIESTELSKGLQEIGRSVSKRLGLVNQYYEVNSELVALVDVLITWRNNIFHEANDNAVQEVTRRTLLNSASFIADKYRGLIVDRLVDKAERGAPLTFKETASLIKAAHDIVEELDTKVLKQLNVERYCAEAVQLALDDKKRHSKFRSKYASLDMSRRKSFVTTWLKNEYGITNPPESTLVEASDLL
ncbi:MAG TPA: hypothetical protein VJR90_09965 [Gammaproteobacteria bacterium]|nr:hypothetical protein [Gammaproteobacteria bacterium]